jgi:hypothetical protein
MENLTGEAVYLFCLAPAEKLPAGAGTGLDGQPLSTKTCQGIAAIFCLVSLKEFCGPEAEARMQDLTWLGPRALRHQEVIAQAMQHSPVLPMRFGTLFSSWGALEKLMTRRRPQILAFLEMVVDQEEWAVKGLLDKAGARDKIFSQTLAGQEAYLAALPAGQRYFQEQRLRAGVERQLRLRLKRIGQELAGDLSQLAAEFRQRRVLNRASTGRELDMVLNWAFLVPRRAVAAFQARLQRANRDYSPEGLTFEYSGPWPPYSFAPGLHDEAGAGGDGVISPSAAGD